MPENGKKRHRSPEHPAFGLREAIEKARVLYRAEHFNYASVATALEHWGYKPKSGSGLRLIAALGHFGLLEEEGTGDARKVKLSDRGKVIVLKNPGDPEWDRAVHKAALAPSIYLKLWEEWSGNGRLPSAQTMTFDLNLKWGFNPNAIESFISDFKGSLEFAKILDGDILGGELEDDPNTETEDHDEADQPPKKGRVPTMEVTTEKNRVRQKPEVLDFSIPLRGAAMAVLSIPVPLSSHNFTQLEEWLKWAEDSLVYDPEDDE